MTKQEIIDKINTGIRGQGSMVDIGGVLADVLTELVEGVEDLEYSRTHPNLQLSFEKVYEIAGYNETQTAEALNITVEDFRRLMKYGGFVTIQGGVGTFGDVDDLVAFVVTDTDVQSPDRQMDFIIKISSYDSPAVRFFLKRENDLYTFGEV